MFICCYEPQNTTWTPKADTQDWVDLNQKVFPENVETESHKKLKLENSAVRSEQAGWHERVSEFRICRNQKQSSGTKLNHRGLNKELAKMEAWTSLFKQEADVDDYLGMSCRCVDLMMAVNPEAAPTSLEIDKGHTGKKQKGRGEGKH